MVQSYNGEKLTPIFWSEVSSSYMLYSLFYNHQDIAKEFVKLFFSIPVDGDIKIDREHPLLASGSVDILMSFKSNKTETIILIETKVHDYESATRGQINTYYSAALDKFKKSQIYFIYLSQFDDCSFPAGRQGLMRAPTIDEFERSIKEIGRYQSNIQHMNWHKLHDFMGKFENKLCPEESMILTLHKTWMQYKCQHDLDRNTVNIGQRDIKDYFSDLSLDIPTALPFGKSGVKKGVQTYRIDLASCTQEQLGQVVELLRKCFESKQIDTKATMNTEGFTLTAAKSLLSATIQDETRWALASFYSAFFNLINEKSYVKLFGSGTNGFSLKVRIKNKGEISLCTLWCNKRDDLEFFIKR